MTIDEMEITRNGFRNLFPGNLPLSQHLAAKHDENLVVAAGKSKEENDTFHFVEHLSNLCNHRHETE